MKTFACIAAALYCMTAGVPALAQSVAELHRAGRDVVAHGLLLLRGQGGVLVVQAGQAREAEGGENALQSQHWQR